MAIACPVDLDTLKLRAEIRSIYARVATEPSGDFHFHRGPAYAAEMLGYDAQALAELPAETTASFAGIANPHRIAPLSLGATVVDIGCGAGMDLLLAARAVGPQGRDDLGGQRRIGAGRQAQRGPLQDRPGPGGWPQRLPLGPVHPDARGAHLPQREQVLRLALPIRP